MSFDVFLSYRRSDAMVVKALRDALAEMGIRSFLDTSDLQPGIDWGTELDQALKTAPAFAVLIGKEDIKGTQEREVRFALDRQVAEKQAGVRIPVIPVILPGARSSETVPFSNQNSWVNFADGINQSELERLYFGILGKHRTPLAPPRREEPCRGDTSVADAVGNLVPRLMEGAVSFIIGSGISRPPSIADMVSGLSTRLRENDPDLPDVPTLDLAGSYYAVDRGDELAVEDSIRQFLSEPMSLEAFPIHTALAKLVASVAARSVQLRERSAGSTTRAGGRDRSRSDQAQRPLIIVTSNYDVLMERALLREGVRFLRCVQHLTAQTTEVGEYDPEQVGDVQDMAATELDRIIKEFGSHASGPPQKGRRALKLPTVLASGKPPDAILYKILGSGDVTGSCFISTDQHYKFLHDSLKEGRLPDEITSIVRNSRLVFLGYSFFDPMLRLLRYTLLLDRPTSVPCFAVKTQPRADERTLDWRLEGALWSDVRKAWTQKFVTLVEADEVEFLTQLAQRFVMGGR